MHRFFADERGVIHGRAWLCGEDAGHALRVLRLAPGDEVELVCAPERYLARIESAQEDEVCLRVECALRCTEAKTQVTLYQGLPKADKMEWIVQKSTELGATAVIPVEMERSVVRLSDKDGEKKAARWQKIAREAVKQCARISAPLVTPPQRLSALLPSLQAHDMLIVPWEDARDGSIAACLAPFSECESLNVGILIGPEGGISPQEAEWLAREAGAKLVTLGPRILRTETAAIAAQTMVMACRGEMQ